MSGERFLPGYLRLLLLLYKHRQLDVRERKQHGYTLNDVYMLEAHGLLRRDGDIVRITERGEHVVKQEIAPYVLPEVLYMVEDDDDIDFIDFEGDE